jgi:hypothetical protein
MCCGMGQKKSSKNQKAAPSQPASNMALKIQQQVSAQKGQTFYTKKSKNYNPFLLSKGMM